MTSAELLKLARTPGVLTAKQLEAVELKAAGYGARRAGRILGISPQAAQARLDGALSKLAAHTNERKT